MTYLQLEEVSSDDDLLAQQVGQTVKCSWCGEIIRLDGHKLDLAMCQVCYDRMLAEFLRAQQAKQTPAHASDR
jgi:formylmethanofuran dehydrogenase subunit E